MTPPPTQPWALFSDALRLQNVARVFIRNKSLQNRRELWDGPEIKSATFNTTDCCLSPRWTENLSSPLVVAAPQTELRQPLWGEGLTRRQAFRRDYAALLEDSPSVCLQRHFFTDDAYFDLDGYINA